MRIKVRLPKKNMLTVDIVYALAAQNREGFEIVRGVVGKYLDKCGRRYVNLSGIFSFMA
jgi:hypothetical protein